MMQVNVVAHVENCIGKRFDCLRAARSLARSHAHSSFACLRVCVCVCAELTTSQMQSEQKQLISMP